MEIMKSEAKFGDTIQEMNRGQKEFQIRERNSKKTNQESEIRDTHAEGGRSSATDAAGAGGADATGAGCEGTAGTAGAAVPAATVAA